MNKLTQQEFQERVQETAWAREIFIKPDLTNNISEAYEAYCKVFDKKLELLTTSQAGNRPPALFDRYERPKCSECGADLMFRVLKPNDEGFKTQLICSNPQCDTVFNSEMGIEEWEKELKRGPE